MTKKVFVLNQETFNQLELRRMHYLDIAHKEKEKNPFGAMDFAAIAIAIGEITKILSTTCHFLELKK